MWMPSHFRLDKILKINKKVNQPLIMNKNQMITVINHNQTKDLHFLIVKNKLRSQIQMKV